MDTEIWALALAGLAGLACGFLNTAASSGSAVSLPILMAIGLDPVTANATNRLPVLIGAMSATGSFQRKRAIPWHDALVVAVPVTAGAGVGAVLAEVIPSRDLGLVITAAVLVALLLLFTKLKSAIANAEVRDTRLGAREITMFTGIGVWLGFIVLDGATYLLLALTLAVGLPLVQANAVKTFALVPTTLLALVIFAAKGHVDWEVGAVMAVTAVAGGILGAKLTMSPAAQTWVFRLLVLVILGELVRLTIHYVFGPFDVRRATAHAPTPCPASPGLATPRRDPAKELGSRCDPGDDRGGQDTALCSFPPWTSSSDL